MAHVAGYWYWRFADEPDAYGRKCVEIVHTVMTNRIVRCTHEYPGGGARVANALNRLYGSIDAPVFDEHTGEIKRNGHTRGAH